MPQLYNPAAITSLKQITYKVNTAGDAWFNSTIASTDSPDNTADKAEVLAQCQALSPLGVEG